MLELMMAAQREAQAEKAKTVSAEAAVASTKGLGAGFKKGFFGSGGSKTTASGAKAEPATNAATKGNTSHSADIIEVKKKPASVVGAATAGGVSGGAKDSSGGGGTGSGGGEAKKI